MDEPNLLEALRDAVGDRHVVTGVDRDPYRTDEWQRVGALPVAVALPRTTEEVAAVVTACSEAGAAVVTQGGHTGLSGGAQVTGDVASVLVSLRRMNTIEELDPTDHTIRVQAGVTIEAIQEAAADAGRLFAPDWGARGTATIGGAVSTNAGGINVLHYGTMRDHVLGLEVVLADGRVWNGLRSLRKDSTGYRLADLFIGAEGTLGIVTRAVLRLLPAVHDERSAMVALRALDGVLPLLDRCREAAGTVTAFELIPAAGLDLVVERIGRQRPMTSDADWYVLVRIATPDGLDAGVALGELLREAAEEGLIIDAVVAASAEQTHNLWALRDDITPRRLFDHSEQAVKFDLAVPVSRIVEFVERAGRTVTEIGGAGWQAYLFGHVGDGNLHYYCVPVEADPDPGTATRLEGAIDRLVLELGGTLSAEHGVGTQLLERVTAQKSDVEIDLAWRIKQALDPTGLFNPGKTLPPRETGA